MKLQVWWIPQVSGKPFITPVDSVEAGAKVLDILALYDLFQYENSIKPDYCKAGGLQMLDEENGEWVDWYDDITGSDDLQEFVELLREKSG